MKIQVPVHRVSVVAAIVLSFVLGACASNPDKPPSPAYEEATASSESIRCPVGQVLTCEAKRTGRIRFGKMGGKNLDSCSCEMETGMPVNSPLPGIY